MHIPVLLHEIVKHLKPEEDHVLIDGTLGSGGHAYALGSFLGKKGILIAIDHDEDAIKRSKDRLSTLKSKVFYACDNYSNLRVIAHSYGVTHADRILLDFGISSNQLEESGRGFSFQKRDEPLLMTMKKNPGEEDLTARLIVNTWDEKTLELILRGFGEEKYSHRIAEGIVTLRKKKEVETVGDFLDMLAEIVPPSYKKGKRHFATKTFQALRMAVNEELQSIEKALPEAFELLGKGGRLGVITFHSLEDRIVKQFFQEKVKEGKGALVVKKPIVPTHEEEVANKRSRSAKLRIIEAL